MRSNRNKTCSDLVLFNVVIDTMLRSSDLLALKVEDVTNHTGEVVDYDLAFDVEVHIPRVGRGAQHVQGKSPNNSSALRICPPSRMIEVKCGNRSATDLSLANEVITVPTEMLIPAV